MGRGGAHAILRERVSHSLLARGHTTHAALTLAPPLTLMMHSQVSLSLSLSLSLSHSLSLSLSLLLSLARSLSLSLSLSPNASGCFTCPWASVAHSVAVQFNAIAFHSTQYPPSFVLAQNTHTYNAPRAQRHTRHAQEQQSTFHSGHGSATQRCANAPGRRLTAPPPRCSRFRPATACGASRGPRGPQSRFLCV